MQTRLEAGGRKQEATQNKARLVALHVQRSKLAHLHVQHSKMAHLHVQQRKKNWSMLCLKANAVVLAEFSHQDEQAEKWAFKWLHTVPWRRFAYDGHVLRDSRDRRKQSNSITIERFDECFCELSYLVVYSTFRWTVRLYRIKY